MELKTEADGRVFPVTRDLQTVAARIANAAQKAGVLIKGGAAATTIDVAGDGFAVKTGDGAYDAAAVVDAPPVPHLAGLRAGQGARPRALPSPARRSFRSGSSRRCSRASRACPCRTRASS